jgi:UDP-N-acetyl-2-amino-2-deoxyglucuronate dehydrogenase
MSSSDTRSPPPRPVGVALIGCGRISASHMDAIRAQPALARLAAVVDADLQLAKDVGARYDAPFAFDSLKDALALPDVEAVLICTPNALHAEQTLAALAAGRHVLVEKPMAENGADAARMAEAADRTGLVLAIGHTFRHSAPIRPVLDHAGEFGALRAIEVSTCVRWDGPQAPWWKHRTPEQGLILSLFAPHALDFVQLFMEGDDPVRVSVEAARHQTEWLGEDEAMILLRYPNQRMASVHISYNQAFVVDRKTLHFEKAMIRIEDGEFLWVNGDCVIQPEAGDEDGRRRMGGRDLSSYFRIQIEEFVHAVRGLKNRSVLQHEGRRLIDLIDKVLLKGRFE